MIISRNMEEPGGQENESQVEKHTQESQNWGAMHLAHAGKRTSRQKDGRSREKGCSSLSDFLHAEWHILVGLSTTFSGFIKNT